MEKGDVTIMNYHNISYPDMNNGDGLRVVLWLSGCSHHCKGCQNPQTWDPDSGIEFDIIALNEMFEQLNNDYISGITFTGGDPLHASNLKDVFALCIGIRQEFGYKKSIWLYTGYSWEDCIMKHGEIVHNHNEERLIRSRVVEQCDVLVDGRYEEDKRSPNLPWVGSSNQRVIDVQKSLKEGKVVLWTN